jgi:hypothetical protein
MRCFLNFSRVQGFTTVQGAGCRVQGVDWNLLEGHAQLPELVEGLLGKSLIESRHIAAAGQDTRRRVRLLRVWLLTQGQACSWLSCKHHRRRFSGARPEHSEIDRGANLSPDERCHLRVGQGRM